MKRSYVVSGIVVCGILAIAAFLQASGIVPAIVPSAVPSANRRGTLTGCGGSGCFQLASSASAGSSGAVYCDDGSGNLTTSGCTANAVTSTTPVTVNTNTTNDQQLMELSLSAGYLNSLGRPFDFFGAGVYTTQTAQTPTLTFKIKLCTVSGCGSGTVVTLVSITSGATTAASTNISWNVRSLGTTAATGATGNLEIHGPAAIDLGSALSTAATVYNDTNTAVSGNIDLTAALFVDFTIAFSTNAATANTCTQREGSVSPGGSTAGGGGGTTVTVAAPYITISGTKRVNSSLWPFTAFFTGTFLDTNTVTLTAGANGSEQLSGAINANSWYMDNSAATTSIESEFGVVLGATGNSNSSAGIVIYDNTNSKLYSWEITIANGTNGIGLQETSWNCASPCNNPVTPSGPSVLVNTQLGTAGTGPYHLQLIKSAGNLLARTSGDAGQTYTQYNSTAIGTITQAGVSVRGSNASNTIAATFLSTLVN